MAKKKPVPLINTDDLDAIDQQLGEAMAGLDGANARIEELLAGQDAPGAPSTEAGDEEAPDPSGDETLA